jgi:hypothetical protein
VFGHQVNQWSSQVVYMFKDTIGLKSPQRRALCAVLLITVSCAALGVAAAQTPPAGSDQAAPAPLPVLARYSLGENDGSFSQLAWSPDGLHVALTGVKADDKEHWVMIYGALSGSAPLRVQKDVGNPTRALWLDPTHLAVIDPSRQRVWEVTADGVKPADLARLNAMTPQQIQRALDDQCVRHDPARGLNVITDGTKQGLRWSHPMQPRDLWLGDMTNGDAPLPPCVSPDGGAVAFMTQNKDNHDDADFTLISLTGQTTPTTDPAPALWGTWTQAQILQAISPENVLNIPNITLQILPWPGRADTVAVFTYGHAPGYKVAINASVLIDKDGALTRAATTSLSPTYSDRLSVTIGLSPERFHDTESTLRVTQTLSTTNVTGGTESEEWSYLRWHDDKLDVILSFEPSYGGYDCDGGSREKRTLTILKPARDGFHDVSIDEIRGDYHTDSTSSKMKKTWRWDGAQYQLVK